MIYGDVINKGWHKILPKKKKYTKRDVKFVMKYFKEKNEKISEKTARWIVYCTAVYYDVPCSEWIINYNETKRVIGRMVGLDK